MRTDKGMAERYIEVAPNTHRQVTSLLMIMDKYKDSQGKKTWLGGDKGAKVKVQFYKNLDNLIIALFKDGVLTQPCSVKDVHTAVVEAIDIARHTYPNWPNAYNFAGEFFLKDELKALATIEYILKN